MPDIAISRKVDDLVALGDFKTPADVIAAIDRLAADYAYPVDGTQAILEVTPSGDRWRFQIGGPASDMFVYVGAEVTSDLPSHIIIDGTQFHALSQSQISARYNVKPNTKGIR